MSNSFDEFLTEQLQDDSFRKEYEALQSERSSIQAMVDAKKQTGLTQKQLSERTEQPLFTRGRLCSCGGG